MATIGNMTVEELKRLIEDALDERLTRLLGRFEEGDLSQESAPLGWTELRRQVERHRWTPPPGARSALELLREDRDR